jgi:calcineurin-like phosphoesterase family protein
MNETLIENYNRTIGKNDMVVWVGDCFMGDKEQTLLITKKLRGRRILVKGNHDQFPVSFYLDCGFEMVIENSLMLDIENMNVKICHYPYITEQVGWVDKHIDKRPTPVNNEILIHGHTHQYHKIDLLKRSIHVGVDSNMFYPVLYDEVVEIVKNIKSLDEQKNGL